MPKKLLLIDTFNFLHRAYHALPDTFTDKEGNPTNAVFGTTSMIISIFDSIKPDYAVAATDGEKPTFRVEEFTGYKAQRKPMEDNLASQIPKVFEIIDAFGVKRITIDGYEAHDVIGTMSSRYKGEDVDVIIASNDRDLWQLVDDHVMVMLPNTKTDTEWIREKEVVEKYGFSPEQLIDYKGLRGDPSDNIPGVYGVGDKTAKKLIDEFGNIEEMYKNIDKVEPATLREKLLNNYETALLSKKLATIITEVPMTVGLDECKYDDFNKIEVKDVLEKYNFKSLLRRLGFETESTKQGIQVDKAQTSLF